jgi:aldehyde:ferredoxin oxidoreductase
MRSLIPMDLSTGDTPTAIHISLVTPIRSTMVTTVTAILTTMAMVDTVDMDTIRTAITAGILMWCMQVGETERTRPGTQVIAVLDTHAMADMWGRPAVHLVHRWGLQPDLAGQQVKVAVYRHQQREEVIHHQGARRELIRLHQVVVGRALGLQVEQDLPA